MFKVKLINKSNVWSSKKDPMKVFRTTELTLEDNRYVKITTQASDPEIRMNQEFNDDYIVTEEKDYQGNPFLKLHKKNKEKPFNRYQKEPINTKACLINNIIGAVAIPLINKAITWEQVMKIVNLAKEEIEKDNIPVENKTSQETPKNEKKEPLTDRQTAIIATLSHCGYGDDDDQRHFVLESITGVNSIHLVKIEESQLFWDFVNEAIGRKREKGEPLTKKDLDNLKIQLDKLGE